MTSTIASSPRVTFRHWIRYPLIFLLCGFISLIIIKLFSTVHWPAYSTSHVLTAVTLAACTFCLIYLAIIDYWHIHRSPGIGIILALQSAGIAAFTTSILAIPLAGTRLYLGGISIDQQFRTEFLTRSSDGWALHDMTYAHLPSYYPSMWFWIGGKFAHFLRFPAWEIFKPYSILTLCLTAVIILFWWHIVLPHLAGWLSLATVLASVPFAAEPYSTALAMLLPPAMYTLWNEFNYSRSLSTNQHASPHRTLYSICNFRLAAVAIVWGISAASYTLYTGIILLMVLLLGCYGIYVQRKLTQFHLLHLVQQGIFLAVLGVLIALPWWLPFISALLHDPRALWEKGSANSYLPPMGAEFWLPFTQISLLGVICLIGLLWIIANFRISNFAVASGICILSCYIWQLLSLCLSTLGTTLLSFRVQPIVTVFFSCAGIICVEQLIQFRVTPWFSKNLLHRPLAHPYSDTEDSSSHLPTADVSPSGRTLLLLIGFIAWTQFIPHTLIPSIDLAYSDTDGYGLRADARPPSIARYYPEMHRIIQDYMHQPEHNIIISTSEYGFLALYPYYGFQSLTPHYANPLAHFADRNAQLITWSHATDATTFQSMLHASAGKFAIPTVWIFRTDQAGQYILRLSRNVFPNDPNVQRFSVIFTPQLFDNVHYAKRTVGPFTIFMTKILPSPEARSPHTIG